MSQLVYAACDEEDDFPHVCDPCDEGEGDGVRGVFFYKDGAFADDSAPTLLEFTAGILAQTIKVVPETRGTYDGGTPTYGEGFGDRDSSYESSSYKLNFIDPNYALNNAYYNSLQKQTQWNFGWRSETKIHCTQKKVTAYAKDPHSGDIKKKVRWDVEITWTSREKPAISDLIDGVFNCITIEA